MRRMLWVILVLLLGTSLNPVVVAQEDGVPALVAGNTAFALDLYGALRQDEALVPADGNVLFSPYSISQALAMTYAGAGGETAAQMRDALAFDLDQPALHEAFHDLNADLVERGNAEDDPDEGEAARALRIANALWGEQTFPFSPAYSGEIERYYGAGLQQADFIDAPEEARQEINAWVEEQTEALIKDIVPETAITPETRLVLANAIYFFGQWTTPFSASSTRDGDFFLVDGTTVTVPFMFKESHLRYGRGDGYQVVEFPYDGSNIAFTVILPDEGEFEAFEDRLDAALLATATGQLATTEVRVYLPKFAFEFSASLPPALQALGMTDAFDPARADLSGMVDGTAPAPLWIGDVLHKARISVDENGTEAAASTVVIGVGAAAPGEEPPEVRIDRPFLFAIRDTQTGTLLFLGRVMDPSASAS